MKLLKKIKNRSILVIGIGNLALLTFILLVILEKKLDPRDYSEFAAFWSLLMGIVMGFTYPLETNGLAVNNYEDKVKQSQNEHSATKSVIVVLSLITLIMSPIYIPQIFDSNWLYLPVFLIVIASFSTIYLCRARLLNKSQFLKYSVFLTAEGAFRIIFAITLILILGGSGLQASLAVTMSALVVAVFIAKSTNFNISHLLHTRNKIDLNIFNLVFANLVIILVLNVGPFFIHALDITGELAGKELNSLTISRIPVFLGPVVQSILIPKFQNLNTEQNLHTKKFFKTAILIMALFSALWVGLFGIFGKAFVELLFGPDSVGESSNLFLLASITGSYLILIVIQSYLAAKHLNKTIGVGLGFGLLTLIVGLMLPLPIVLKTEISCAFAMFIPLVFLLLQVRKINSRISQKD